MYSIIPAYKYKRDALYHHLHHLCATTMSKAIHAYKEALRATRVAFKNDLRVLQAARSEFRRRTEENRSLADQQQIDKAVQEMSDVANFLIKNIVQAEQREKDRYFLHFHDKTELGSNETIKQNNRANMGTLAGVKAKKCH